MLPSIKCGVYHGTGLFTESLDLLFPYLALLSLLSSVPSASGQHAGMDRVAYILCCWGGDSGAYRVAQVSCDVVGLVILPRQCCIYGCLRSLFTLGSASGKESPRVLLVRQVFVQMGFGWATKLPDFIHSGRLLLLEG